MLPGRQHIPVDFGRRMAGSTEEEAVDAMEFGQHEGMEHLEMASEEEARMVFASKLPPPEARDLGSFGMWAGEADLHPLAMDHLAMIDEAEIQSHQPVVPQPQAQLQPPRQEIPPDPTWVVAAPQVAQDMKKASSYWPDPLRIAEFADAIDHGKSQVPDDTAEEQLNTDRRQEFVPYGQRVYVEERWDESRVMHPGYDCMPPMQQEAVSAVRHQQHPTWAMHRDMQSPQSPHDLQQQSQWQNRIEATSAGRPQELPPGAKNALGVSPVQASTLAARLGSVIAHLEQGDTSDTAIGDLREIEASYNASLNGMVRS